MFPLCLLKNTYEFFKKLFKQVILRARLQSKHPTCRVFPGVVVDFHSNLGRYNVLFNNVTIQGSTIGDHTYVQRDSILSDVEVGKFCSIASGVFIGLPQHSLTTVSTHPAFYLRNTPLVKTFSDRDLCLTTKRTVIGHDVWIGQNAIVMSGLKVGIGAAIGAGAVVTKDVPDYAVVGGVPARIIKHRFDEEVRTGLLQSKWWDLTEELLERNVLLFQDPVELVCVLRKPFTDL